VSEWIFADVWERIAALQPEADCLIQGGRRVSWGQFDQRADGVADFLLRSGLGRQAKVAQYLYSCSEYIESVFACFKAALVPVNTNFRYRADELVELWLDADIEAVVFDVSFSDRIDEIRHRLPEVRCWLCVAEGTEAAPAWSTPFEQATRTETPHRRTIPPWGRSPDDLVLLYTGGTTGRPKGVMWRQDDVFGMQNEVGGVRYSAEAGIEGVEQALAARRHRPPRLVPCAPLVHGTGGFSAYAVLNEGGAVVLLEGRTFSARELLDTVQRERVTQLAIVGDAFSRPIVSELDAHPGQWDLSSLWLIVSSGMIWSNRSKADLLRHLPQLLCVDSLGSSEAIGIGISRTSAGAASGGERFVLGPNARVVDDDGHDVPAGSGISGVLMMRGRTSLGYYKDAAATNRTFRQIDGELWSVPGDVATVDADGTFRLLGRGSSVINTGGEKVFAEEVEEVLKTDPSVFDAAVIGLPDERFGQSVAAAVQPLAGHVVDIDRLVQVANQHLAGYKVPRRIVVMESVGRGPTGKLDYQWLRQQLSPESERS
jgi:acyl-CoA synthetase (AMP-forming)/AMP-acid ligase II